jgi:hypothetical protein
MRNWVRGTWKLDLILHLVWRRPGDASWPWSGSAGEAARHRRRHGARQGRPDAVARHLRLSVVHFWHRYSFSRRRWRGLAVAVVSRWRRRWWWCLSRWRQWWWRRHGGAVMAAFVAARGRCCPDAGGGGVGCRLPRATQRTGWGFWCPDEPGPGRIFCEGT